MKKLNRRLIKGTNWALAGIISLLGFSACSDDDTDEDLPIDAYIEGGSEAMYGVIPTRFNADIIIRGKVVDENGKEIPNIKLETKRKYAPANEVIDAFESKKDGSFQRKYRAVEQGELYLDLIATDIDGEQNGGSFGADTTDIILTNEELQNELTKKEYQIRLSKKD